MHRMMCDQSINGTLAEKQSAIAYLVKFAQCQDGGVASDARSSASSSSSSAVAKSSASSSSSSSSSSAVAKSSPIKRKRAAPQSSQQITLAPSKVTANASVGFGNINAPAKDELFARFVVIEPHPERIYNTANKSAPGDGKALGVHSTPVLIST